MTFGRLVVSINVIDGYYEKMRPLSFACLLIFSQFLGAQVGLGHDCSTKSFDQTPPNAIRSDVLDLSARFSWMSDVDVISNQTWGCSCILNLDDKGWSGSWEKAGISVFIGQPLMPGKEICREEYLGKYSTDLDAPIIYGATGKVQMAAVFRAEQSSSSAALQNFWSFDLASFQSGQDVKEEQPVRVSINLVRKEPGQVQFNLGVTPGYTIALADANIRWDSSFVDQIVKDDRKATRIGDIYNWANLKKGPEMEFVASGNYLAFSAAASLAIDAGMTITNDSQRVDFVVFDKERKPVLKSFANLPRIE